MESSNGPRTITIAAVLLEDVCTAAVGIREAVKGDDRDEILGRVQTLTSNLQKALQSAEDEAVAQQAELAGQIEKVQAMSTRLIDGLAEDEQGLEDIATATGGGPTARPLRSS